MRFHPRAARERWFILGAVCLLTAAPVLLFLPALWSGKLIWGVDTVVLGFPAHAEVMRSLAAFQWPLWMPDILGGLPGIAANNLLFLSPTDLLVSLAGGSLQTQVAVDAVLWIALAGIGMFLFLRGLGRGLQASLLGAFFFFMSGTMLSHVFGGYYNMLEGIALAPWAFWAAQKGIREFSWFAWGLCGLVFALQILAQATQIFAYTLPAVAAFGLASAWNRNGLAEGSGADRGRRASCLWIVKGLAAALGLAFLISAPQLWLSLQYLPLTSRQGYSYGQFVAGSVDLPIVLTWLVPGIGGDFGFTAGYLGLLPWALAAGAIAALWRREPQVRWLSVLALTAFVLALRQWTPLQYLVFHLPIFNRFRYWSRILFLVTLAVCALAAFGWDALKSPLHHGAVARGIAVFYALALLTAGFAWAFHGDRGVMGALNFPRSVLGPDGSLRKSAHFAALARDSARVSFVLVAAGLALLWFMARRPGSWILFLLVFPLQSADQFQVANVLIHFVAPLGAEGAERFARAAPPAAGAEPWRVYDYDPVRANNAMLHGYENMCGVASMPLKSYGRIADAMGRRVADWYDLFSARYVFVHSRREGSVPGDGITVYGNRGAFPRAWLVTRVRKVSGDEEAYRLLADKAFNPRVAVALPEDPGLSGLPPHGAVEWLDRSPQTASLRVSTDRAAVLVLSNAWYPSWRARVDGRDSAVLKADGGLQAVFLKAGLHTVDFHFDNGLFDDGLAACLAGLVALLGLARYDARRARP